MLQRRHHPNLNTKIPKANGVASPVPPAPNKAPTRVSPPPQPVPQPKATPPSVISPPKSAYLARPSPEVVQALSSKVRKDNGYSSSQQTRRDSIASSVDRLYAILEESKNCLKGSPLAFYKWLESEDIVNMEDLAAAVSDDEYLHEILQHGDGKYYLILLVSNLLTVSYILMMRNLSLVFVGNVGVKGFKRVAFKKAVLAAVNHNERPTLSNMKMSLLSNHPPN